MNWPRTISFGAIQITAGLLISVWSRSVHLRFQFFHRGGDGRILSNFFWNYAWVYIAFGVLLLALALTWQRLKKNALYESTLHFGYWALVVWTGVALIAMEVSFLPGLNINGLDY
jgi:hypothetical protein